MSDEKLDITREVLRELAVIAEEKAARQRAWEECARVTWADRILFHPMEDAWAWIRRVMRSR